MKILIIYATTDGHTLKICQRLRQVIENEKGAQQVTLVPVEDCPQVDLRAYDKIVIGASTHHPSRSSISGCHQGSFDEGGSESFLTAT